ncbi:chromosomal replication initiator protein DnaA [Wolbachia endosymbiont of Litomosoides brasiliensis]|uniref:chromosomal replication initiator protein DnaA n=1 Tax=Wolbachia endosymbiont of Litomosoides brasiliensis TaxID=1812117 RepID=UPI0015884282|nr:chromosomal replication initiator protein DnaA [Wolbachia endosymbiont of Litomosoides brasiliensis]NUY39450.1 chromosomal replication initiator protein DnaA [Wolbachia endosymbiont of Litomosoides brasiliensis]
MSLIKPKVSAMFFDQIVTATDHNIAWEKIQNLLYNFYGEATYNSWLSSLKFVSSSNGEVLLSAPTRFIKEWITVHYMEKILLLWQNEDKSVCSIDIQVTEEKNSSSGIILKSKEESVNNLGSPLDPRFTFDNFVVGKPNELAFTAARRVAESIDPIPGSNPLFLYGGVGLGKTHLMHAIAWHIVNSPSAKRKVVYLSAEKFMYQYITALRSKDIMLFKEQFRSVDVLMVDDVQFISGKDSTQEEFFHTFNALIDQNKQLVISADRSPSDLDGVEERIKSRLGWGLVADINETTFELRLGILQAKVEQMNMYVPQDVLEFLARNIRSNIRELEGALNKVAHTSLIGRSMTVESASETLMDLLRSNHRSITIAEIQKKIAEFFNIKVTDMHSNRRLRGLVRPRQIAMYFAKKFTHKSLPDIGRSFGGRDHATVIHAVKQIENFIKTDSEFADEINQLRKMFK